MTDVSNLPELAASGAARVFSATRAAEYGWPWWAVLLLALFGAVALVLRAVLPQDSGDRVKWWRDLLRHRERVADAKRRSEERATDRTRDPRA